MNQAILTVKIEHNPADDVEYILERIKQFLDQEMNIHTTQASAKEL